MHAQHDIATQFSTLRLDGESIPLDVTILLRHNEALFERTGMAFNWDEGWTPWLDTSYLRPEELADPPIAANLRAIAEVCSYITFVAAHEDGEYYGYWRDVEEHPIAISPVVRLDNECQFQLCRGTTIAEAFLEQTYSEERFNELRQWFVAIGITNIPETLDDFATPSAQLTPHELHERLYDKYIG